MSKTTKIIIAIILILVLLAGGYFAWRKWGGSTGAVEDAIYMQKVSDLTSYSFSVDRYSGVVEAQKTQGYKCDPQRTVEEIYVAVGDEVKIGTPLFRYDVRTAENSIESIKLDIEGLSNEIEVLRSGGNSTEIQLQISERELEIRQKQAELERHQQEIDQAEVLSTIDGVVKAVSQEIGKDSNGGDLPVVAVTETGEFRVKGKVSEQTIGSISPGMEVIIRSRVDENTTWAGKIGSIETEPASQNNNGYYEESGEKSSVYPFYVQLDTTEGLMLGQHVFIEPDYGQSEIEIKEGIWLDMSFIAYDDAGNPFVWSAERGKTVKVPVELGEIDENTYTIQILSGLTEDSLITWPDETLEEGMKAIDISEVWE
ncbi:MAG: HlyD family efflux transporter periplasmic adaptor subunit [Firmicutes bacterium]|nr:HlyD family efflux transporter periplasmic adaptor subunit [Bacillota bacterium]